MTEATPRIALFSGLFKSTPLPEVIERAAQAGFDGVEVLTGWGARHLEHDTPLDDLAPALDACERTGVAICGLYPNLDHAEGVAERENVSNRLAGFCERAVHLGAKFVKVPAGPIIHDMDEQENCRLAADWLRPLVERAGEFGLAAVIEIHPNSAAETIERTVRIAEMVEREDFGVIHDAGNLVYAGLEADAESVRAITPWLAHVHVKDMRRPEPDEDAETARMLPTQFGEGDVDHGPIFAALIELGYTGFVTCESMAKPDSWEWAEPECALVREALHRAAGVSP